MIRQSPRSKRTYILFPQSVPDRSGTDDAGMSWRRAELQPASFVRQILRRRWPAEFSHIGPRDRVGEGACSQPRAEGVGSPARSPSALRRLPPAARSGQGVPPDPDIRPVTPNSTPPHSTPYCPSPLPSPPTPTTNNPPSTYPHQHTHPIQKPQPHT